ncbi:MAG: hypothetical protein JNL11_13330 [Bdellovibrionaceae bacterium]|nr:hypothetical protein [Pseudobdellovibrionaceae bacterium]
MLAKKIFLFIITSFIFTMPAISWGQSSGKSESSKQKINPYGKYFKGEGLEVEMAVFTEKNSHNLHDAIIKISGELAVAEGIDGKCLKYKAVPAGTGVDFKYQVKKDHRSRMGTRQSWGNWSFFEVYLQGKTIKVSFDETKSKEVKPLDLWAQSQKDTSK